MGKIEKVLKRSKRIINNNKTDDSIYYKELDKSYNEYINMDDLDKATNELYYNHLKKLCDFYEEKKYSTIIIVCSLIIFVVMSSVTIYSSIMYSRVSNNFNNNIISANLNTSIQINYKDLSNFNALTLANEDYKSLSPLSLSITTKSSVTKPYKAKYNIYIVEQNDELSKENTLSKDVFKYNIKTTNEETTILNLKDAKVEKDKILIYTGYLNSTEEIDIDIRMWIDNETTLDYQNKNYRFKLFIDGEVVEI